MEIAHDLEPQSCGHFLSTAAGFLDPALKVLPARNCGWASRIVDDPGKKRQMLMIAIAPRLYNFI
jgi:hypothetical protein